VTIIFDTDTRNAIFSKNGISKLDKRNAIFSKNGISKTVKWR